ncbi:MAG: hypothetical protein KIT77_13995 [Caldilinea sp.]|nr:hypothetical protein [Caldilinea sp.]
MPALYRVLSFLTVIALVLGAATAAQAQDPAGEPPAPNAIDRVLYFNSAVQDHDACDLRLDEDGAFDFGDSVTNPAMTCPDAFAWRLFLEAIEQEFWLYWAADQLTWPAQPLPLCTDDTAAGTACCTPGSLENPGYDNADDPAVNCPYYPGDHLDAGGDAILHTAQPLSKSHVNAFSAPAGEDPGRVIRQEMAELVFRNKPMFDYVFANNIYNTDGLGELFARNSQAMTSSAPYRARSEPGALVTVDFPVDAVMVKSNWLSAERAEELGLDDDPDNPYITMEIDAKILDNNAPDDQFEPGLYYLVAMHISSKDIPNWVWATFEHVNNPGRCDYTGCNDSFGYTSPDAAPDGFYANFTAPHVTDDGLIIASPIFARGESYPGGEMSDALQDLYTEMGIGSEPQADPAMPDLESSAWRSYRLKGSQVDFTDAMGRPTMLGNSVTEGGFVLSSSCMACHARASVNGEGEPPLGVFIAQLSEVGYPQSSHQVPDPDWYYSSSDEPALQAVQTDFVWGFLFANPITTTVSTGE